MKTLLVTLLATAVICGCATKQPEPADPRVGTELTPFRSIPAYIECGDCNLIKK